MKINIKQESPIIVAMSQITDILLAGFLWFLCSLPVITIGPASCALYYTVVKVVRRRRDTITKAFFQSFRDNLKQGIFVTIIFLAYATVLGIYIFLNFYQNRLGVNPYVYLLAGVMLVVPFTCMLLYIFPVMSRFSLSIIKQLQYAFAMSVGHFVTTVFLTICFVGVCFAIYLLPFLMIILPGLYAYCSSFVIERTFRKYLAEERKKYENDEDLPWYLEG